MRDRFAEHIAARFGEAVAELEAASVRPEAVLAGIELGARRLRERLERERQGWNGAA